MDALFKARKQTRARSENRSTVQNRERETARTGLSAAKLKIYTKWRGRKKRAIDRLTNLMTFQQLNAIDPTSCQRHLKTIRDEFDALRAAEMTVVEAVAEQREIERWIH